MENIREIDYKNTNILNNAPEMSLQRLCAINFASSIFITKLRHQLPELTLVFILSILR